MGSNQETTLYSFSGYITNRVLDGIAAGIQDVLAQYPPTEKKYRKIFSIYVEIAQNIIFYSPQRVELENDEAGFGTLSIVETGAGIRITGINPVTPAQEEKLKTIFDHIESLDEAGLKTAYQEKMMSQFDDDESKGGGLGYYDIARKSKGSMSARFVPTGSGCNFEISATI